MAKLLMITGLGSAKDLASGYKGAFSNTLSEFHKYWDRIDIIAPKISRGSTSGRFEVEPLFGNVFVHISPWPLVFHPFWFLKKGFEIYKEQKFDLMTVHEFPPFYNGIGARLLWQKIKVPYILEIFHIPGYPRVAGLKELVYRFLFKLFIRFDVSKAKAVRVMNNQVAEKLTCLGVSKSKIKIIPAIYIDFDIFKSKNLSKEYDLIFVGRLVKNKGIDLLLETASKLKDQVLNFKTIIVGSGPLEEGLKLKIKNLKLQDNVILQGWARDSVEVAELLNKSKILIMPSYNEGGPRVVLEAMSCGIPVLATPVGIVPDVVKDKESGIIIDWNSEDIAEKVLDLLNNDGDYQLFRKNGLEIVKQFEKENAIRNYAEKIQSFLMR